MAVRRMTLHFIYETAVKRLRNDFLAMEYMLTTGVKNLNTRSLDIEKHVIVKISRIEMMTKCCPKMLVGYCPLSARMHIKAQQEFYE